jgi:hypothetical protein
MPQLYREKTGKLIDAWIRLRRKIDNYQKSVTDYINLELADKADLSGRQIERMRRYDGFPEDKSMVKLVNAIPDLESLNCSDFVERLLLPFSVMEQAQSRIKASPQEGEFNTIVIVSGWVPPLGIEQNEIAEATTNNISRDFKYTFLYPDPKTYTAEKGDDISKLKGVELENEIKKRTEKWVDDLRVECEGIQFRQIKNRQERDNNSEVFKVRAKNNILCDHTTEDDNEFWFLLPSKYTVLYNPDKPRNSGFDRYGMFNVKGKLIEFSQGILEEEGIDKNFVNSSSGWLYIEEEEFEKLAELYVKIYNRKSKTRHS